MKEIIQSLFISESLSIEVFIKVAAIEALFWMFPLALGIHILSLSKTKYQKSSYAFSEPVEIFLGISGIFLVVISLLETVKSLILLVQLMILG